MRRGVPVIVFQNWQLNQGRRQLCRLLLMCTLLGGLGSQVTADDVVPGQSLTGFGQGSPIDPVESGSITGSSPRTANGIEYREGGLGTLWRVEQVVGEWIGRKNSLTVFEAMPYLLEDGQVLFGDIRLSRANVRDMRMGGSGGVGYRRFIDDWNRTIGAAFYYDRDNLASVTFEQVSFGVESLGENFDLRANFYKPQGERSKVSNIELLADSARFTDFNVLFDRSRTISSAMDGFDAEIAVPILGGFGRKHDLRAAAGFYYFDGIGTKEARGWSGRLEGNIIEHLAARIQVASDDVFGSNAVFGIHWSFGGASRPTARQRSVDQHYRLTTPVQRNFNIVVADQRVIDSGIIATNPATGAPYTIYHVSSDAPIGVPATGSLTNPFQNLADAQAASQISPADILFVHAGSTYTTAPNNSVVLNDGDVVLGEGDGITHLVPVTGFSQLLPLPRATTNTDRPIFADAGADGVTMANSSEFSGFEIQRPGGNGVNITSVSDVVLDDTIITDAAGDGILISNVSGPVTMRDVEVNNALGTGFHVSGGSPSVLFTTVLNEPGAGSIINSAGRAVLIENMSGGFVNMAGSSVTDTGGQGIQIVDTNGSVTIDNIRLTDSTTTGIDIQRGSGTYTFRSTALGSTRIENPTNAAINIGGTSANINFQGIDIVGRNGAGIQFGLDDTVTNLYSGSTQFTGDVTIDTPNSGTAPAVLFDNSTGSARFVGDLNITGSNGVGVRIGGTTVANPTPSTTLPAVVPITTGDFTVDGTTTVDSAAGDSILVAQSSADVFFGGTFITNRGARGIAIEDVMEVYDTAGLPLVDAFDNPTTNRISFQGTNTINNELVATVSGIEIQRANGQITFGNTFVNNSSGAPGVNIVNNPDAAFTGLVGRTTSFGSLNITAINNSVGLFASNNPNMLLQTGSGAITSTGAEAVDLSTTGTNVTLTSVTSTAAPTGIRLVDITNPLDVPFNFQVVGDGTGAANGSGGTIQGSTTATGQGVFIQDAGNVMLRAMNFNINRTHVEALTTPANRNDDQYVRLELITATNSTEEAVDFLDTDTIDIINSTFSTNGAIGAGATAGFDTIRIQAARALDYTWTITGNTITDATGTGILIGPGTAATSDLTLVISNNNFTNTRTAVVNSADPGDSAINITWDGDVTGTIDNNIFTHTGGEGEIVRIQLTSIDDEELGDFDITNNLFTTTAGGNTGIRIITAGPSDFNIFNNVMDLGGGIVNNYGPNTGMQFNLAGESVVVLDSNLINDISEGTGIIFNTIVAPADVTINNNEINILGLFGGNQERGILFQAVTGQVNLFGTQNNIINIQNGNGFAVDFGMPFGSNNGQVLINGALRP